MAGQEDHKNTGASPKSMVDKKTAVSPVATAVSPEAMIDAVPGLRTYLTVSSSTAVLLMQVLVLALGYVLPAPAMEGYRPVVGSGDYPWIWAIIMWILVIGTGFLGVRLARDVPVALFDEVRRGDELNHSDQMVLRDPMEPVPVVLMVPSVALCAFATRENFYIVLPLALLTIMATALFLAWKVESPQPFSARRFLPLLIRIPGLLFDGLLLPMVISIKGGGTAKVVGSSGVRRRHWVGLFLLIFCAAAEWHFVGHVVLSKVGFDWEEIVSTYTFADFFHSMWGFLTIGLIGVLCAAVALPALLPTLDLVLARTLVGKDRFWRYVGHMLLFGLSVYAYLAVKILLRGV